MKSSFETPPYSTHVEVGGQAELRCHPPLGNPEPVVTAWLRNGVPIDPAKDTNFIISATGRFIPILCQFVLYGRHPTETECAPVDNRLPVISIDRSRRHSPFLTVFQIRTVTFGVDPDPRIHASD
jgi:hypothetical protein